MDGRVIRIKSRCQYVVENSELWRRPSKPAMDPPEASTAWFKGLRAGCIACSRPPHVRIRACRSTQHVKEFVRVMTTTSFIAPVVYAQGPSIPTTDGVAFHSRRIRAHVNIDSHPFPTFS